MKKLFLFYFLFPLFLYCQQIQGKVIKIIDGDTITLLTYSNSQIKIRLNAIDAPEKKQPFGTKSKQYLADMIFSKNVTVQTFGNDRYGRIIGDIYYNNVNVNYEMVKAGYAWMYRKYSNDINLDSLESAAKEKKLGLWSDKNAIAPWEYRKMK